MTPDNTQALRGWRVVITRAEGQAAELVALLRAHGAEPLEYPTIRIAPPADLPALQAGLQRLADGVYDWLVLTSANALRAAAEVGVHPPPGLHVAAVGPATAQACEQVLGLAPNLVPEQFVAESLAAALGDLQGRRVLLLNSEIARPTLQSLLSQAGAIVDRVIAYRTLPATGGVDLPALLQSGAVDVLTFTSGSTVRYFAERVGSSGMALARQAVIACIGPQTAQAATQTGLPPDLIAEVATSAGLLAALLRYAETHRPAMREALMWSDVST